MLVEFYSWVIPYYAVTSRKIINAKESVTDSIISNRQVSRKVLCVMTSAPLWLVVWVVGKEQSASVAFVPNRIVVLYALTGRDFCRSK